MKKWLLFLLIAVDAAGQVPMVLTARTDAFTIDAETFAGYDKFGFGYSIKDNVLSKFKGQSVIQYKTLSLGKITRVDLQNPLQIVVFYEPFNTVLLLDNQLNETRRITFTDTEIPIVAAAAGLASQNRIWIYNSLTQRIGLWDMLKNNYRPVTTPIVHMLRDYYTDFNTFQWIDDSGRHFSCDVYGKITDLGNVPSYDQVRIVDERWLIYSKEGRILAFDAKSQQSFPIAIDEKTFKSFYATPRNLAIFTAGGITNYKLTLP